MSELQVPIQTNAPIKFSDEELKSLIDLKNGYNDSMLQFGQLYVERMRLSDATVELNKHENGLQQSYVALQKKEEEILNSITNKYGTGNLDISSGIFIPTPKK